MITSRRVDTCDGCAGSLYPTQLGGVTEEHRMTTDACHECSQADTSHSPTLHPLASTPLRYCVCQRLDTGTLMIQCDGCALWFHPACVGLSATEIRAFLQDDTKPFLCQLHTAQDRLRANYMQTLMYTNGYVVLPALVDITPTLQKKVTGRLRQAGTIFNANETQHSNDRRRLQVDVTLCDQDIPGFERLHTRLGIPDDVARSWTVLQSLPGCQAQGAHVDYEIDPDSWVSNDPRVSHGCLLALSDGTTLDVWRSAHLNIGSNTPGTTEPTPTPIPRSTITLNAGDTIVFRADCLHAGSAYPEANVRLHCYLDRPKMPHATNRVRRWRKIVPTEDLLDA